MSFLASLLVLSFVFLVLTIFKSRRSDINVLKSSALAVMCGLSAESQRGMQHVKMRGEIQDTAGRMNVELVRGPDGWQLERMG
jgi:hypothetical protein